jgi:hypothetical protein
MQGGFTLNNPSTPADMKRKMEKGKLKPSSFFPSPFSLFYSADRHR